jgi:transglutaminase-like putative cysteine protease
MSSAYGEGSPEASDDMTRVIACHLAFQVVEPAEVAIQVVAAGRAGEVLDERFEVTTDGSRPLSLMEFRTDQGERLHVILSRPGLLVVDYRAELRARPLRPVSATGAGQAFGYERELHLRPSRYCPSDHLVGFAVAEFGTDTDVVRRTAAITEWIRHRINYVPGSSDVHDSAEHTLLTGMGTCRDFAHLGIALCRATGIPARFTAVYAPGLYPMDFHAVFETLQDGRWSVHDPTGLAPRSSLVRIVTGRDAADTAFSSINSGVATLEDVEVTATVGSVLPRDNLTDTVELP